MTAQLRADGTLRHLLTLEGLSRKDITLLLDRAQQFVRPIGARVPTSRALEGVTVANLFTEPSTRTRVSFELAAGRLGARVVNLEVQLSSRVKGESMLDTVFTLESLHVDVFVLRDAEARLRPSVAPLRLLLASAGADALRVHLLKRRGPPLAQPLELALPPVLASPARAGSRSTVSAVSASVSAMPGALAARAARSTSGTP